MKIRINKSIEFWLLVLFVPVESINGLIVTYAGMSFSPIGYLYRIILILYYGKYCLKSKYLGTLFAFFIMIIGVFINILIQPYSSLGVDFNQCFRILYFMVLSTGLYESYRLGATKVTTLILVLDKSAIVMIVIYILSVITNLGISTYGESGYKSWFNASNSLTLVLVILAGIQLILYFRTKKKSNICEFLILALFTILTGAKSGIVFLIIFTVFMFKPKLNLTFIKRLFLICIILTLIYAILTRVFWEQMTAIISRMAYFSSTSDSTLEYLLSGRNSLLLSGLAAYKESFTWASIFIGNGSYNMQILIGKLSGWGIIKSIEMDLFDILFGFGLCGIFCTYILSIKIVGLRVIKKLTPIYVLFWICILFSILGGHVFMDSFGTTVMAIILSIAAREKMKSSYNIDTFSQISY